MSGQVGAATGQASAAQLQDLQQLRETGYRPSPDGIPQDRWLDEASRPSDSRHAQYRELVDIAGGRTDRPSLLRAMDVAYAYLTATAPNATAADRQAFTTTLTQQLDFHFGRLSPTELLTSPLQSSARLILDVTGARNTEWGQSLDRALGQQVAFNRGVAEGIWEGGKSLVTGIATMVGRTLQYGADNSTLGQLGDAARGLTGRMPAWLEAVVPSATRGAASTEAIGRAMSGAADYLSSHSPSEVAADIGNAISAQWDSLKASHAAAAAQGPEAEARWWGQIVGRVGFEVAATFVPVAGIAGKLTGAARAADATVDTARVADAVGDTARGVDAAQDAVRAADTTSDGARAADRASNGARTDARMADDVTAAGNATASVGRNSAEWTLGSGGQPTRVTATLSELRGGARGADELAAQDNVRGRGIEGDDAGHLIGHRFMGDQGERNMFPQNFNFNRSAYKTMENEWAAWIENGGTVRVNVDLVGGTAGRPERINVSYEVFNESGQRVFDNIARFRNEAGQAFERVSTTDIQRIINR
jgi:DNA/RNA non-specific endonuclease